MKRLNQEEVDEMIRLHEMWVRNEEGGVRADFSGCDCDRRYFLGRTLTGAIFVNCNLTSANFSYCVAKGSDFRGAYLLNAKMMHADFSGAIFSGAYLSVANFYGTDLKSANFDRAELAHCSGNDKQIKNINNLHYSITYTIDRLQIGCRNHSFNEWWNFSDEDVDCMGAYALDRWKENKELIRRHVENNPAER